MAGPHKGRAPAPSFPKLSTSIRQATREEILQREHAREFGAFKRQTSSTPFTGCADSQDRTSTSTAEEYAGYTGSGGSYESTSTAATSTDCGASCLNDDNCVFANYNTATSECVFYESSRPRSLTAASGYITYVYSGGNANSCSYLSTQQGYTAGCCNFYYGDTYD